MSSPTGHENGLTLRLEVATRSRVFMSRGPLSFADLASPESKGKGLDVDVPPPIFSKYHEHSVFNGSI